MPELLWVNKNASSKLLSRSRGPDHRHIRRHVQRRRAKIKLVNSSDSMGAVTSRIVRTDDRECPAEAQMPRMSISSALPSSVVRMTTAEARGIEFYIRHTAKECAGWQDDHFWSELVIQAGSSKPGIAHALVAVAAWHEGSSDTQSVKSGQPHAFSSLQWEKALVYGRTSVQAGYSTALVHCVNLACLQAHRSHHQDVRLLQSASAMLRELDEPGRPVSDWERHSINSQVRPLVDRLHSRICSMCDSPAALWQSVHSRRLLEGDSRQSPMPSVPASFATLRAARDCLENILVWARDCLSGAYCLSGLLHDSNHHFDALISAWEDAATSLADIASPHATVLLRLASLHGVILIKTCMDSTEMAYDAHIPIFRQMMDILTSHDLSHKLSSAISFGIDGGLIDIVAFIASRCRDPGIRRTAMTWLQTASRVEGDRPSLESAQIASAWMQIEEEGVKSPVYAQDILKGSRWILLNGARYHSNDLTRLTFERFPFAGLGEVRTVDIEFGKCDPCIPEAGATTDTWIGQDYRLPDVLIHRGGAAFLQRDQSYYRLQIDKFFFPIPKV